MNKSIINICLAVALSLSANASAQQSTAHLTFEDPLPTVNPATRYAGIDPLRILPPTSGHAAVQPKPHNAAVPLKPHNAATAIYRTIERFAPHLPEGSKTVRLGFDASAMKLVVFTQPDYDEKDYCTILNTLSNLKSIKSLKLVVFSDLNPSGNAKLAFNNFLNAVPKTQISDIFESQRIQ